VSKTETLNYIYIYIYIYCEYNPFHTYITTQADNRNGVDATIPHYSSATISLQFQYLTPRPTHSLLPESNVGVVETNDRKTMIWVGEVDIITYFEVTQTLPHNPSELLPSAVYVFV
jgi:hypothetical protein